MAHDWKTWKIGMKLYIPYKKEIRSTKGIECPICRGKRYVQDPFTNESYPCPGVVFGGTVHHHTCIEGQIFPQIISYKVKEHDLESFTVEYPGEKLNSITLVERHKDWPNELFSRVVFGSHKVEEMYFFKTEKEAQEYCDKMNQEMENCVNET